MTLEIINRIKSLLEDIDLEKLVIIEKFIIGIKK